MNELSRLARKRAIWSLRRRGWHLSRLQGRRMLCALTSQILRNPADRQEETTHGNPASANGGILAGLAPATQRYIKLPSFVLRLSSLVLRPAAAVSTVPPRKLQAQIVQRRFFRGFRAALTQMEMLRRGLSRSVL